MKKIISSLFVAATLAIILYGLNGIRHGMYNEYGDIKVHGAIVQHMEKEGHWPRSWSELEPYYKDLFFDMKTTRFIRQHYEVAWHVDPFDLLRQSNEPPSNDALYDYADGIIPVVYKIRKEQPISDSTTWILSPWLHQYLTSAESTLQSNSPPSRKTDAAFE